MKILINNDDFLGEDISREAHARHLLREQFKKGKLPWIPGVTRALEPGWCDYCENRAWTNIQNGRGACDECQERLAKKMPAGFPAAGRLDMSVH